MKALAAITALFAAGVLSACQTTDQYDGVSRFAMDPEIEAPLAGVPEIPGRTDQDTLGGKLDGAPGESEPAPTDPA